MRSSAGAAGRLVYVLGSFPSLSETFVLREIEELERRGFRLSLLSLEPGEEVVHRRAEELAERTVYRPSPLSARSMLAQLVAVALYPFGYAAAVGFVLANALRTPRAAGELIRSLAAAAFLACALRGSRPRHVHAHFASMPATVGLLLALMLETAFSFSAHARDLFAHEAVLMDKKLREAEFVAVCTRHGLEQLRLQHPVSSGERLNLIYHGVDVVELMPPPRREPSDQAPLILSVGRLVEKKGFPILLRAAAILRQRMVDFRLRIVGSGPEEEDLRRMVTGLALGECVQLDGPMPHEELLPIFRRADLFVLASVVASDGDRDGLPNVLLEALALGVPAVGTQVSAIPELIEHEETGLLAGPGDPEDLADQMERMLFDEELRARVIEQGRREVVTRFDIRENVTKLVDLFSAVMTRRR
ncbi:MAG: glycosyltransferase [Armatimonadota bacterium]|nr:glycosyltransferase [Armatimonadota bacterium]